MKNLTIDARRLWESLMEMAKIGATPKGGVARLALTDLDRQGRLLFVRWCREAGCAISIDKMGNVFARRPGRDPSLPPVMMGSHLDSQPTGGKYDGAYGVLAGLEVIRSLNDHGYETLAPLEVAVWTNEEGSRFAPAMTGSGVFAGVFPLDFALRLEDVDGRGLGEELSRIGFAGEAEMGGRALGGYVEAHIEQGPILEHEGKTIGVVTHAQGQRWYEVTLTGRESHAGPTPMAVRRDALVGAARIVDAVNRIGHAHQPGACATVGMMQVFPNSRNVIPGRVFFTIDLRHPDDAVLARMDGDVRAAAEKFAQEIGLAIEFKQIWHTPPIAFDPACVGAVRAAASDLGLSHRDIVSGAGHDACYVARVAPTGMVFVPCKDGLSHNEEESATPDDLAAGCRVLMETVLALADRPQDPDRRPRP